MTLNRLMLPNSVGIFHWFNSFCNSSNHYLLPSPLASDFQYILSLIAFYPTSVRKLKHQKTVKDFPYPICPPSQQSLYPYTSYQLLNKLFVNSPSICELLPIWFPLLKNIV